MNEQRVYQMTKLAIFEEEHKDQLDGARRYFRSDFIGRQIIRTGFRTTAAYIFILAGWAILNLNVLMIDITEMNIPILLRNILFLYAALMCVMTVLTYSIHSVRYAKAEKDLEYYQEMLRKLELSYEIEEENRTRKVFRKDFEE